MSLKNTLITLLCLVLLTGIAACAHGNDSAIIIEDTNDNEKNNLENNVESVPQEIMQLFDEYIFANKLGVEFAVECLLCEAYFFNEKILDDYDHLLSLQIERFEKIDDQVYKITIWIKSRDLVISDGWNFSKKANCFICNCNGEWRLITDIQHAPENLKKSLEEIKTDNDLLYREDNSFITPGSECLSDDDYEKIPTEVTRLLEEYLLANMLGVEYSVEYMYFENDFIHQAYIDTHDHLLDFQLKNIERINDYLYAVTLWVKSRNDVFRDGDKFREVYNFICCIDDKWFYINGMSNIPEYLQENLDKTQYTYDDPKIIPHEDVFPLNSEH